MVVDQLQPVEVTGHDVGVRPLRGRLLGQGADDVIGLVPGQLADRHPHHGHYLAHDGELRPQVIGHARATRLVLRVGVESELRLADVEADDRVVRLEVLHPAQHDLEEAEDGVHEHAVGERQRL